MALTDSLDAATQQVLALLAQIKLSNTRNIQAQDTGAADNVTLTPTPAISAYGPDLLVLADIANANATTTPKINVSALGQVLITASDGTAVKIGAVAGKCLFGFSSAVGGGYVARLLFAVPAGLTPGTTHKGDDISTTPNLVTVTVSPAITAYAEGDRHQIKLANDITGPGAIANICGIGNRTIVRADGSPTQTKDGVVGQMFDLIDDGTHLQIAGLRTATSASQAVFATTASASMSNAFNTVAALAASGTLPAWCSVSAGVVTILQAGRYEMDAYYACQGYLPSAESAYAAGNILINNTAVFPGNAARTDVYLPSGSTLYASDTFAYSTFLAAGSTIKVTATIGSSNADISSCSLNSAFLNIVKGV